MIGEGIVPTVNLATGNGSNGANGGFGFDNGAWWIIILFLFVFCGWGNNGNGFGGGGSAATQGALTREQACIDNNFQNLMRETASISDSVNLGFANLNSTICNQQYDTARMINGVDMNIMQGNFGLQTAINGVSSQLAQCCCDVRESIAGVNTNLQAMNFNNAQNTCTITNAIDLSTRNILDAITANRIEDKNAQIAMLQTKLNNAELAASQSAQSQYLINELSPKFPVPAFLTCNPFTGQTYSNGYGYGYNNGCGCGC